ncbi:MAG: hypothetical protein ACP5Q2_09480, partial [Calditerrivibrio sp.]
SYLHRTGHNANIFSVILSVSPHHYLNICRKPKLTDEEIASLFVLSFITSMPVTKLAKQRQNLMVNFSLEVLFILFYNKIYLYIIKANLKKS